MCPGGTVIPAAWRLEELEARACDLVGTHRVPATLPSCLGSGAIPHALPRSSHPFELVPSDYRLLLFQESGSPARAAAARAAAADGGPHQTIEPGDSWLARFGVHQTASTGWYHPHAMGTTAEQVAVDSLVVAAGERYEIVVDTRVLTAGAVSLWITATSDAEVSMGVPGITVDAGASATGSGSAITRDLPATFERHTGLFMYHCHMLEHEEHGMMGQLLVGAVAAASVPHFAPNPGKGEMKWRM